MSGLNKWMKERRLQRKDQLKGLIPNLLEELTEFSRAKTDEERIDALCDMSVFSLNCLETFELEMDLDLMDQLLLMNKVWLQGNNDQTNKFVLERLIKTFYLAIVRDTDIEAFVEVCFSAMRTYGYDPYKAMHETIKEISSRTGHFDPMINKFVKDQGFYSLQEADEWAQLKWNGNQDMWQTVEVTNDKGEVIGFKFIDDSENSEYDIYPLWYKADYSKAK